MRWFVFMVVLASCHPPPPCYVFAEANVTDHPLYTRLLLVSQEQTANGPVFYSAEDALAFAKDADLLLCATSPAARLVEDAGPGSGVWCAGHFNPCPCDAPDAGRPDAGTMTFTDVAILPDGGVKYSKELR